MLKYVAVLAVFATCVVAESYTPVSKCSSGLPLPIDVKVDNCKVSPCELKRGSDLEAFIKFETDHDFEEANMYVKANALGVETSFPMPDPSVCKHLEDNACPLVEGDVATYKLSFHIFALLPTIPVTLEMTITSEKNDVMCFRIETKVV